jgi:RNA polymerase sigma-70 factor (ECF subfamily)
LDVDDLATHHYAYVRNFVRKLTDDRQLAEDITQQTFLRACEHREQIQHMAHPVGWLLVVARRLVCDQYRHNGVLKFDPLDFATGIETDDPADFAAEWLDIRHAISRLSATHQRILHLAMLEMTYSEWSARTGKTISAIKMSLVRARAALSREVA